MVHLRRYLSPLPLLAGAAVGFNRFGIGKVARSQAKAEVREAALAFGLAPSHPLLEMFGIFPIVFCICVALAVARGPDLFLRFRRYIITAFLVATLHAAFVWPISPLHEGLDWTTVFLRPVHFSEEHWDPSDHATLYANRLFCLNLLLDIYEGIAKLKGSTGLGVVRAIVLATALLILHEAYCCIFTQAFHSLAEFIAGIFIAVIIWLIAVPLGKMIDAQLAPPRKD